MEFVKNPNLLGLDVAQYNPDKDNDGAGAKKLVDLLVEALTARLQAIPESETATAGTGAASPDASSAARATDDATAPLTTHQDSQETASGSEEESSSGMSAHETNA
jgi:hypothetical protein